MSPNQVAKIEAEILDSFLVSQISHENNIPKLSRLAYHRIIFVTDGVGSFNIDDKHYNLEENQLYLISQGQIFDNRGVSAINGFQISFGDCFWKRTPGSVNNCKAVLFNNAQDNQCLQIQKSNTNDLLPHFNALINEYVSIPYINKLDVLAAFLKIIMIKIANLNASLTKGFDNYEKQLFREFLESVSQDYHYRHEVSDYAKQFNITPRRLSEISKRCTGKTAKDIINGQLVAEAKRHLQFSTVAIKEIAFQLSFATPEQFSHFFKKNVNTSPTDYRSYFAGNSTSI
ncbi:helix-turn-helix transcriptional regulator [Pedobacter aquatilis]|uniref:AraC family transcriptional regulator n=1 Tax=Pedobacter aquatilis TaxID=351343 RepID=UPI002931705C|nr:helix-turn-helix transcriptional regulator [Pedobacter aquatilis]